MYIINELNIKTRDVIAHDMFTGKIYKASRSARVQAYKVCVNATVCGLDSHSRKLNIQYFHICSSVEAKHGVAFRQSTRNASGIRWIVS